ncbi:MAG: ABC transporter ATP-binding protein [Methanomassiliicoccales archaeon]|jgi:ABC-2 type transport system ATP-binding protein
MPVGTADHIIECRNISKVYGSIIFKEKIYALTDINIALDQGEICGLVGSNGTGKSTLMKVIMGIEPRQKGDIIICCTNKHIGYIPERPIFFDDDDAFHNLLYFARLSHVEDPEKKCKESLIEFGLGDKGNTMVNGFSTGMKQRLAIARSLLNDPEILTMDEPFSGLDPTAVIEVREHLLKMKQQGKTILLSSHDLSEIDKVCDSIIFIENGKVVRKQSLHSVQTSVNVHILLQEKSDKALEIARSMGLHVALKDDLNMIVEIEKESIPDLLQSLTEAHVRIVESRIIQRTSEDFYTEIFVKEGSK